LDVGCATGRLVFEYGKLGAEKIIGVDSSKNFIDFCNLMKNGKQNLVLYPHQFLTRCQFLNTDIMKVSEENFFTFITCINVIDRVPNPKVLIEKLYDILDFGGILLLVVPYDWAFSPAPQKYHTRDIKSLLDSNLWMIEKEIRDVSYTFPLDKNNNINYKAHFIIVKKIFSR